MNIEIRPPRPDDADAAYAICSEAFASSQGRREDWLAVKRMDDFLCAWAGDQLVATTEAVPVGQHFGGRSVPMGAVASVAVRPDQRGRGIAPRLLAAAVEQMHERGLVVSTLHPATTRFYRALGWEVAGEFAARSVPSSALVALPHGEPACMRPATSDDRGPVRECYLRVAPGIDGSVDRNDTFWAAWELDLEKPHHYLYAYDGVDGIDGYVKYRQVNTPDLWGFSLIVHELVAATPEAGLTLWRHVASHAAQVEEVVVYGSPLDDLTLLLPEQKGRKLLGVNRWMTRLVDATGAIGARGFPPGVTARVDVEVVDRLAPWNDDRFVLDVADGRGSLRRGGTGGVRMTVNAFASLYTGWASAFTLAAAGLLHHAGERELRLLDAAFAGPTPYLFDDF
jgi:predicted acetyltransferase